MFVHRGVILGAQVVFSQLCVEQLRGFVSVHHRLQAELLSSAKREVPFLTVRTQFCPGAL